MNIKKFFKKHNYIYGVLFLIFNIFVVLCLVFYDADDRIPEKFAWQFHETGVHLPFKYIIKMNMTYPKTFKCLKTRYWVFEDYIVVAMTFEGRTNENKIESTNIIGQFNKKGQLIDILKLEE